MATVIIPAITSIPGQWRHGKHYGTFKPNRGRPELAYARSKLMQPNNWKSTDATWAARIFVGFNVGETPTYTMDDLIALVKKARKAQVGRADSTFIYQKGIYTHSDGKTEVTEDGAQVVFINLDPSVTPEDFEAQMVALAEVIVQEMQQETVIVELQRNGIVQAVIGVTET